MPVVRRALHRAAGLALDQLLPKLCALCNRPGELLCPACAEALPPCRSARCSVCWQTGGGERCPRCAEYGAELDAIRAPYAYRDGARRLVGIVKYRGVFATATPMAALLATAWRGYGFEADVVVPVPLHLRRERARGFNQAALLARELARLLGLRYAPAALRRARATDPQARTASALARRENVHGAFAAGRERGAGARVLLVDDVVTTGATLAACAAALFDAGAEHVYGLAFATAG